MKNVVVLKRGGLEYEACIDRCPISRPVDAREVEI
jgi:hypothetical protein